MRLLWISPYVPSEHTGHAGAQLIFRNLKGLSRIHDITLLCFASDKEINHLDEVKGLGIEVHYIPVKRNDSSLRRIPEFMLTILKALLYREPLFVAKYRNPRMKALFRTISKVFQPDIIHIEYNILHHVAGYDCHVPVILTAHDISTKLMLRMLHSSQGSLQKFMMGFRYLIWKQFEKSLYRRWKYLIVLTEEDKVFIRSWTTNNITVVPPQLSMKNILEVSKKKYQLIFSGSFNRQPNIQALEIILNRFVGPIKEAFPKSTIIITGRYLTNHLKRRIDITNGIEYAGFVKNIDQLVAESILCLAPIMSGAGLKMKLTQALQCGTPVITTPVGAEGIPLSEDDGLFVEQDIPAMVERTLALLQAPETLITLGQKARQRVGEVFDSDGILEKLNNLYHQALKNS